MTKIEQLTQVSCIRYKSETYIKLSDIKELLLLLAATEETDTRNRIEELIGNIKEL